MKYTMAFMALGLSAVMLTGCGSNSDIVAANDSGIQGTGPGNTPETTADAKASILGTWEKGCIYNEYNDESRITVVTFRADDTLIYSETTYPTQDCTGDSTDSYTDEEKYKVGAKTEGSDSKTAFEFDVIGEDNGVPYHDYFMVRYTSTELLFSGEKEDGSQPDGKTPETRNNYFNPEDKPFTKK